MEIDILFEDNDLIAINKPEGLMVHNTGHTQEPTVVDWFLQHVPVARGGWGASTFTKRRTA